MTVPFLTASLLGYLFSDMVRVVDCHAGVLGSNPVPRFTGKTRITGKTTEIPVRPKNNREILICPSPIKKAIIEYC